LLVGSSVWMSDGGRTPPATHPRHSIYRDESSVWMTRRTKQNSPTAPTREPIEEFARDAS
jgi:hypothetical protein